MKIKKALLATFIVLAPITTIADESSSGPQIDKFNLYEWIMFNITPTSKPKTTIFIPCRGGPGTGDPCKPDA